MDEQDFPITEQDFARLSLDRNPSPIPAIATLNPPESESSDLTWSNPSDQEVSTDALADRALGEEDMSISDDEPVRGSVNVSAGESDKDQRMGEEETHGAAAEEERDPAMSDSPGSKDQEERDPAKSASSGSKDQEECDPATSASTGSKDQPKPVDLPKPALGSPIRLKLKPVKHLTATSSSSSAPKGSKERRSNKSRGETQDKVITVSTDESSGEPDVTAPKTKTTGSSSATLSKPGRTTKSQARKKAPRISVSSDNSETEAEPDPPRSNAKAGKAEKGKLVPGAVVLGTKRISKRTMHGSLDSNITAPISLFDMIVVPVCHCSH